jgi:hypothetical protein
MPKDTLNILHISDLHFGLEPATDGKITSSSVDRRNSALKKLIEEISKLNNTEWKPNIIAITGDIGWKCNTTDYEQAGKWLKKLMNAVGLNAKDVILCPGNHDVDRNDVSRLTTLGNIDEANRHLTKDDIGNFSRRCEPFKNYVKFCCEFGIEPLENGVKDANPPSAYLYGYRSIDGVIFIVLNSAWDCRNRQKPETDQANLWLGENLVLDIQSSIEEKEEIEEIPNIKITLFHHPEEYLHRSERVTDCGTRSAFDSLTELSDIIDLLGI